MAKYGEKAQSKVGKAMHERKAGSLRRGGSGKKATKKTAKRVAKRSTERAAKAA
jgi:hypothetical protein